jgi:hypothetical protein
LLGKPQVITRNHFGTLRVTLSDIQNIHLLLQQRISEQNHAALVQFTGRIFYSDRSSVEVQGFENFCIYAEVRPLVSVQVNLTWVYLIDFPHKDAPERQQIDVEISVVRGSAFSQLHNSASTVFDLDLDLFPLSIESASARRGTGRARVVITHTARGWATDIENLLMSHIENSIKRPGGIRKWVSDHQLIIGFAMFVAVFSAGLRLGLFLLDIYVRYLERSFQFTRVPPGLPLIEAQLHAVVTQMIGHTAILTDLLTVATSVLLIGASIAVPMSVASQAADREPSFVLLTRKSLENEGIVRRAYDNGWRNFFVASALTVALSIIANAFSMILL